MSLRGLADKVAKLAFNLAGDVPLPGIYMDGDNTGLSDDLPDEYDVEVLIEDFSVEDQNGLHFQTPIAPGDVKGSIVNSTLPINPRIGNTLTIESKGKYSVKGFSTDPADAVLVLLLRSTKS